MANDDSNPIQSSASKSPSVFLGIHRTFANGDSLRQMVPIMSHFPEDIAVDPKERRQCRQTL
jgi:hypothetical protein